MSKREGFSSRLGFLLISAGCAIGLGNVWRFPYIVGRYGGAAFVLVYLLFLIILGLPVMVMEFSVGRASQRSIALSFRVLEPKGSRWHLYSWFGIAGNYLLMMFYTTVAGWLLLYCVKMLRGDFVGLDSAGVGQQFQALMGQPWLMTGYMAAVVVIGMLVCSRGIRNGVEKVNKAMMLCLLLVMVVLVIRSVTLSGAAGGLEFYLKPNFHSLVYDSEGRMILGETIYAAMGQAFFTLSLGSTGLPGRRYGWRCWTPLWRLWRGSLSSRPVRPLGLRRTRGPVSSLSRCPTFLTPCLAGGGFGGSSSLSLWRLRRFPR